MGSFLVAFSLLLCGAAFTVANYPLNPKSIDPQYRQITVQWDNITNFNSSGQAKQLLYQIESFLPNKPSYLAPNKYIVLTPHPKIVLKDLFIDSTVSVRIGLKSDPDKEPLEFSKYLNVTTKSVVDVGEVAELPEKVTGISASLVADGISKGSSVIQWRAPDNIIASNDENVTSIEYRIDLCNYNPLLKKNSQCKPVAQIVANASNPNQRSRPALSPLLSLQYFNLQETRDVAVVITPIALNKTEGASAMASIRMDSSSIPDAPTNLENSTFYADQISITWSAVANGVMTYLIQYNIKGSATKMKMTSNIQQAQLSNLQNSTEYEIRVAIADSNNGTSPYSLDFLAMTSDEPAPKPSTTQTTTKSSSSYLFSSYSMIILTIAAALFV